MVLKSTSVVILMLIFVPTAGSTACPRAESTDSVIPDETEIMDIVLSQTIPPDTGTVGGDSAEISDESGNGKVITTQEIEDTPATSVTDVLRLLSGVISSEEGLHVRGGRSDEISYLLDGYPMASRLTGFPIADIPVEALEQIELISGDLSPEYGDAMSGLIRFLTIESHDRIRGHIQYRTSSIGLNDESRDLNEHYVAGVVSGPISEKLGDGFVVAGRIRKSDGYYQSGLLSNDGQPSGLLSGEPFSFENSHNLYVKTYARPIRDGKLSLTYNLYDHEWRSYAHDFKYIPESAHVHSSTSHLLGLTLSHSLSRKWVYQVRASYHQSDYHLSSSGLSSSEYSGWLGERDQDGEFLLNPDDLLCIDEALHTYTGKLDIGRRVGPHHLLKSGIELKQYDLDYFSILGQEEDSIDDYHLQPSEGALFLLDRIKTERFLMNVGLRWEFFNPRVVNNSTEPADQNSATKNAETKTSISPRIGLSWRATAHTMLRGAYGQLVQRPPFEALYGGLERELTRDYPLLGDPDLDLSKTVSYEVGIHNSLIRDTVLKATAFYKEVRNLLGLGYFRQGPGIITSYYQFNDNDIADVKGIELSAHLHQSVILASADYTYQIVEGSYSMGNLLDFLENRLDPTILAVSSYPLNFDQLHTFKCRLILRLSDNQNHLGFLQPILERTTTAVLCEYGSGFPYSSRLSDDINSARMPETYTVDVKLAKRFPMGSVMGALSLEVLNLFNRKNVVAVNEVTGELDWPGPFSGYSRDYATDPSLYANPRTFYVGLGITF